MGRKTSISYLTYLTVPALQYINPCFL